MEDDDDDRMFAFEVSKTNEQDENVTQRKGFTVCSLFLIPRSSPLMTSV